MTKRLYKKGDKVTLTIEVLEDQQSHARPVWVKYPGCGIYSANKSTLDEGVLEPVPEPPYVPKPGDLFRFRRQCWESAVAQCHFIDSDVLVYKYQNAVRYDCHNMDDQDWSFVKIEGVPTLD